MSMRFLIFFENIFTSLTNSCMSRCQAKPLFQTRSNAHFFYHCDGNGNVTCLADARQNIAARYLYDPFGNTLSIAGPEASINRYRFSSKPIHEASGMYDYLYRWYVPELQRWLNRDPLGEFGGVNL